MNQIIIVAPNHHLIFNMTVLNQTDYILKSNNNERRDDYQRYLYCQFFIRNI
jgi:hypothetical protein